MGDKKAEVSIRLSQSAKDAIQLIYDVMEKAPDLLLEFKDLLLEQMQGSDYVVSDLEALTAPQTDEHIVFVKFGDEFFRLVSAMGARYRQRGFVVPSSFDE